MHRNKLLRVANTLYCSSISPDTAVQCDGVNCATGLVSLANGTASDPSLFVYSYLTSGIFLPASTSLGIGVSGTTVFSLLPTAASTPASVNCAIQASTTSDNTGEGALVVVGGVGISKNCYVGGNVTCGLLVQTTMAGDTSSPTFRFVGNTSTGIYLPASDSIGIMTNNAAKLTLTSSSATVAAAVATTTFNNTTESSNTTSGSIVVAGGMTVGGAMYIGGNVTASSLVGGSVITSTTDSGPPFSFTNSTGTGIYKSDGIYMSHGGNQVSRMKCDGSNVALIELGYLANAYNVTGGCAIGYGSYTSGGIAIGNGAYTSTSSGNQSAIGKYARCYWFYDVAIGYESYAWRGSSYQWAISIGCQTSAQYDYCITMGSGPADNQNHNVCYFQYMSNFGYGGSRYGVSARYDMAYWWGYSDESMKTDITDLDLGMDLIREIRPITFKFKDDDKKTNGEVYSQITHYGFSYQRIKAALDKCGIVGEHSAVEWRNEKGHVSAGGLLPSIVRAVRELKDRFDDQQRRFNAHKI